MELDARPTHLLLRSGLQAEGELPHPFEPWPPDPELPEKLRQQWAPSLQPKEEPPGWEGSILSVGNKALLRKLRGGGVGAGRHSAERGLGAEKAEMVGGYSRDSR